jgi:hypothetical protein
METEILEPPAAQLALPSSDAQVASLCPAWRVIDNAVTRLTYAYSTRPLVLCLEVLCFKFQAHRQSAAVAGNLAR